MLHAWSKKELGMTEYEGQFAGQIFEALSVGLACGAVTLLALSPSLGQGTAWSAFCAALTKMRKITRGTYARPKAGTQT
jgi:F0F1-type ATP synthase membrane subunit c/vacuolar-type H+-ATPase subunit K